MALYINSLFYPPLWVVDSANCLQPRIKLRCYMKIPCKDCADRHESCHNDSCQKWMRYRLYVKMLEQKNGDEFLHPTRVDKSAQLWNRNAIRKHRRNVRS